MSNIRTSVIMLACSLSLSTIHAKDCMINPVYSDSSYRCKCAFPRYPNSTLDESSLVHKKLCEYKGYYLSLVPVARLFEELKEEKELGLDLSVASNSWKTVVDYKEKFDLLEAQGYRNELFIKDREQLDVSLKIAFLGLRNCLDNFFLGLADLTFAALDGLDREDEKLLEVTLSLSNILEGLKTAKISKVRSPQEDIKNLLEFWENLQICSSKLLVALNQRDEVVEKVIVIKKLLLKLGGEK